MEEQQTLHFRLMTYNVGGARRDSGSNLASIVEVIKEISPDVLVIQEAREYQYANLEWDGDVKEITKGGNIEYHHFLGPVLSLTKDMDIRKPIFVKSIFEDWREWRQGNAILSRWEFVRLGDDPSMPGEPRNIPLYRMPLYQGNRDSESRYALLGRVNCPPIYPYIIGVHLSTLLGERGKHTIPGKLEEAKHLRVEQARRLLDLLRKDVLEPRKPVFLLGDFNAAANESCISTILEKESEFMRLIPQNRGKDGGGTHPKVEESIDHIFVFPPERVKEYTCWIVDSLIAQKASDHLPVVADVVIKNSL
jgi:endonuclease/exonuclease/phosphatase family metal-dependent hydrolase